jgi:hypothetical protein
VRCVGDELAARVLEPGELGTHPLEGTGQLAELVAAPVDDRPVELTARDPVGGALQAPDPPREHARAAVAQQQRDPERHAGGGEQRPLHLPHPPQGVLERGGEEHDRVRLADRAHHFGEALPVAHDDPARRAAGSGGPGHDGVLHEVGRRKILPRVGPDPHPERLVRLHGEHDHARVRGGRALVDPVGDRLPLRIGLRMRERVDREAGREQRRRPRLLVELRLRQRVLDRRPRDHEPGRAERDDDDEREGEGEPRSDAPERIHPPRKR